MYHVITDTLTVREEDKCMGKKKKEKERRRDKYEFFQFTVS